MAATGNGAELSEIYLHREIGRCQDDPERRASAENVKNRVFSGWSDFSGTSEMM